MTNNNINKNHQQTFQKNLYSSIHEKKEAFEKIKKATSRKHMLALVCMAVVALSLNTMSDEKIGLWSIAILGMISANQIRQSERETFLTNEAIFKTVKEASPFEVSTPQKKAITEAMEQMYQNQKEAFFINLIGIALAIYGCVGKHFSFETMAASISLIENCCNIYTLSLNKKANRVIRAHLPKDTIVLRLNQKKQTKGY